MKKKNELTDIRQGNEFVKAFYEMSAEQQNIFYFAVANLQWRVNPLDKYFSGKSLSELPSNTFCASFRVEDMLKAMDLPNTKNIIDVYYRNFGSLAKIVARINQTNRKRTEWIPIFSQCIWYGHDIDIVFNTYFLDKIFNLQYTSADLRILGQLSIKSKNNYAQRLYFYLAMYRNTQGQKKYHNLNKGEWNVSISVDYFREMVSMKDNQHQRTDSFRRLIKNLVTKINSANSEFVTTVEFRKNELKFVCNDNLSLTKLPENQQRKQRQDIIKINQENRDIEYVKKKYPKEWQEEAAQLIGTQILPCFSEETKQGMIEYQIYQSVVKRVKGGDI